MSLFAALTCNYEVFDVSQLNEHEAITYHFYELLIVLINSVNEKQISLAF